MIKYLKSGDINHSLKFAMSYSGEVDEFTLDKLNGKLVKTGTRNVDEIVQSCADCALDKIFEKYSALGVDLTSFVRPYTTLEDGKPLERKEIDLADLGESIAYFDSIKEKYGLNPELSIDETIKYLIDNVEEFSSIVDSKLTNKVINKTNNVDIQEEVNNNEKENITQEVK